MKTSQIFTESQAIDLAKINLTELSDIFTFSNMSKSESEDFIWGYLYDMGYQYYPAIDYIDNNGNTMVILIHEQ